MAGINPKVIYTIAKKEFLDNIRNKWIIVITIIFIILTIASSYLAGGQAGGDEIFGGMEDTVVALMSIYTLLIPLIAIMLGFSTIAGEAEKGALSVVLSYPVKRVEVLLGKFLGLGSVLAVTPLIGFGLSGIVIATIVGAEEGLAFIAFIALAIILGLMYLSLIICISALCRNRVRAIAGGIILFFWAMIYGMIVMAVYYGTGGDFMKLMSGEGTYPDWLWSSVVFSPSDLNQMAVMRAFGLKQAMGISLEAPDWMSMPFVLAVQLIWIIIPLILAYIFFKRRDI
ncbi:MAG: ABC transporter permease subunit [Candidatus Thermoplasmatota archaeon]|nr:ABC transporter permease subunit [Candidatus Thermoplasmatota archaeon]